MSERARKAAYAEVAEQLTRHWAEIEDRLMLDLGALREVLHIRDAMRAASEVPLSPTGEQELLDDVASSANGDMTSAEVDAVDRRYRELVASGRLDPVRLREAFERRFPPKAQPGPLAVEVQPVASRLEREEAGRGHPPSPEEGQGPAAVEGLPPASVLRTSVTAADSLCDRVAAWVNAGFPDKCCAACDAAVQGYRDHLHDCDACARVVQLRIAEEEARKS